MEENNPYPDSPYNYLPGQSLLPNEGSHQRQSDYKPKPILICPGDFSGAGKEYRYPLGQGLNCQMCLSDNITLCKEPAYWYCDQTMTCCGMYTLFKGCGKRMCDNHCMK